MDIYNTPVGARNGSMLSHLSVPALTNVNEMFSVSVKLKENRREVLSSKTVSV